MADERGYVVMTYPRCGGTYFAQLLGATGVLGRPEDWFNVAGYRGRGVADYPADRAGQAAMALSRGRSANGVYGLKLSVRRLDELSGYDWAARVRPAKFIHLYRADRLARAVSDVISLQTMQYRSTSPKQAEPRYDPAAIRDALTRQGIEEARVHRYFAQNGIAPLELSYEEVAADEAGVLRRVGAFLDVADMPVPDRERITLKVQRDAVNAEWRERFVAEHRDLRHMPEAAPRSWRDRLLGR